MEDSDDKSIVVILVAVSSTMGPMPSGGLQFGEEEQGGVVVRACSWLGPSSWPSGRAGNFGILSNNYEVRGKLAGLSLLA